MTAHDFADLLGALLAGEEVRDRDAPHPHIMIWGTLEARVQGADLLILGSLNEGSWPEAAPPDPWLNRQMRNKAGLLLPERRIGLSAHDFQQAVGAPEVWLTRATRSDDAETVPSRWLNRLTNLLQGLPGQGGPGCFVGDARPGSDIFALVRTARSRTPDRSGPAPVPAPAGHARPRRLSVTEIKRLIRDPYAIYAKHVLRLKALDPLVQAPDALLRGIVIHDILEHFVKDSVLDTALLTRENFLKRAETLLDQHVAWPTARKLWLARLGTHRRRFPDRRNRPARHGGPVAFEAAMKLVLSPLDFTIAGRADRIDQQPRRAADRGLQDRHAPDRKPAGQVRQTVADRGGDGRAGRHRRHRPTSGGRGCVYRHGRHLQRGRSRWPRKPPDKVLAELKELISAYLEPDQGFTSRRMLHKDTDMGDYDHLARFGEWDRTDDTDPEV